MASPIRLIGIFASNEHRDLRFRGDHRRVMKVVYVIDTLGPGGAERSTALLAKLLAERGVDVSVVTLYTVDDDSSDDVRASNIRVTMLQPGGFVGRVRELRKIVRRERPDLVHTALFSSDQLGRVAALGTSAKVISSLVNVPRRAEFSPPGGPGRLRIAVVNLIDAVSGHLFVNHFHAVTPGVARLTAKLYRLRSTRITVVERGRPVEQLGSRTPDRRDRIRNELRLDPDAEVVVAAGRHEHQKAHVDLVRAVATLRETHPRLVLLIAGRDGSASQRLRAEIENTPALQGCVMLLGHRRDVADLLAAADVMALSSRFEGAAGIVVEAMGLATPIASTRLDGLEGILVDQHNALLSEPGDVDGLARSIAILLDQPELAQRLGAQAKSDFLQRFTLDQSADRMLALYRDVLAR